MLQRRLHRLVGEQGRGIAAAFHEGRARHHRVAQQLLQREGERLLDHAVDDELVLRRIDIGNAVVQNGEVQRIGRDRAIQLVMRRARVLRAGLALRVRQDAHSALLEARARAVFEHVGALMTAPFGILDGFGGGAVQTANRTDARGARERHAAAQKRATMQKTIAGDDFIRRGPAHAASRPENAHRFSPLRRRTYFEDA